MKNKVFGVLGFVLLPIVLLGFIKTKSCTDYECWESVLGIISFVLLYWGYANWCYNIVFKDEY